jgi:hypothetical protein
MARDELLEAARRAAEVLDEFAVRDRIKDGYTRVDHPDFSGLLRVHATLLSRARVAMP